MTALRPPQFPTPDPTGQDTPVTARIGRPPRSVKPRLRISTTELLTAVADLGPNWPARFGDYEIADVNEALDRELLAGNLLDAITLTDQGRQTLPDTREPPWVAP